MPKGKGKGFSVSMLFFTNQPSNDDRESTHPSSTPSALGFLLPLGPWIFSLASGTDHSRFSRQL